MPGGNISTLAGTLDTSGDSGDEGDALAALLNVPGGVTSWQGHIAFVDEGNDAIRVIW